MKEQVPEGVVKNGKYKNYYVWAGARTEREADKTEPGEGCTLTFLPNYNATIYKS
jgi:hypothetical protein